MALLRSMGRDALIWAGCWGGLGLLWILGPESVADVMTGSEMWPIAAAAGVVLGFGHGALNAILWRTVTQPLMHPRGGIPPGRRRVIAGATGAAAAGIPWLFFQPVFAALIGVVGFLTAAVFPGKVD